MGRIWNKIKGFFGRVGRGVKKAVGWVGQKLAPVVKPIASVVGAVASKIPHPIAQGVGKVAQVVSKGADIAQRVGNAVGT